MIRLLKAGTFLAAIFCFISLGSLFHHLDGTLMGVDSLVAESKVRMVGTSQNLNAVLIQVGLVADNVRRASESQDKVSKKTLALLDNANELLAHTKANEDQITLHTVQTMDGVKPVLDQLAVTATEVNTLVADQNVPQILTNLNDTSKQVTATMEQATATMENVTKTSAAVQGYVQNAVKPPSRAKRIFNTTISILIVASHFL